MLTLSTFSSFVTNFVFVSTPHPLPLLTQWKPVFYPVLYEISLLKFIHERDYGLCVIAYFMGNFVPYVHTFP